MGQQDFNFSCLLYALFIYLLSGTYFILPYFKLVKNIKQTTVGCWLKSKEFTSLGCFESPKLAGNQVAARTWKAN